LQRESSSLAQQLEAPKPTLHAFPCILEPRDHELGSLATELELSWRNTEQTEGYREACRHEYAKTLVQQSQMKIDAEPDQEARSPRTATSSPISPSVPRTT
jgi:hypothetical protein